MKLLLANIPTLLCLGIAGILAVWGQGGWGWFLFVGLLLGHVERTQTPENALYFDEDD